MYSMTKKIFLLFTLIAFCACENKSKTEQEIEAINIDFEVVRFDEKFAEATPETLPDLQEDFPFLFPQQFSDQVWIEKLNDTIQQEINEEIAKVFPDFSEETYGLHNLFQHIKYYFPGFEAPKVITVTSEVDYKNKIILTDDFLFIALDNYLGKDHRFYIGLPEYFKKNFRRSQITPDVAHSYAKVYVKRPEKRQFISQMLYYGKLLYLKDLWIPFKTDAEKIGYTGEELEWAEANEEQIWRYFIEKELIFDADSKLYSRFLHPAPFSKFYLELDSESPDRLGQYIGWQIIREYMDRYEVGLKEMLATDEVTIFNNAKYKPKK